MLTIPEGTGRISKSSCTPSLSRTSASADLTTNASIDPLAANAILALGNQFCPACPTASADALLTAPSTQFAIGGFCPRGTSAAGNLSFLPGSHCCVATEDHLLSQTCAPRPSELLVMAQMVMRGWPCVCSSCRKEEDKKSSAFLAFLLFLCALTEANIWCKLLVWPK